MPRILRLFALQKAWGLELAAGDILIEFKSMSYRELWSEWEQSGEWESEHVQRLRAWYEISL